MGKVKPLICKSEKQYLLQMKSEKRETNFVRKRTTNSTLENVANKQ